MSNSVLQIRDLRVTFNTQLGELWAVRGIDVDVAPGEILGVVYIVDYVCYKSKLPADLE